jgi:class 3 adenylate cyclase
MPQDVVTLMAECVDADPSARPTFRDIDHRLKEFKVDSVEPGRVAYSMQLRKQMDAATNLLNEIFPQHIAEALASGRRVEPEHFDCVTIFFSDIVGFTTICSDLTPIKVSDLLDRLYLKFDSLSKLHGVFKVETIGDAWMGVTNLASSQQSDHTQRIAEFAADAIRAASATLVDTTDPSRGCVKLRVGFHSGPVVANVVGTASPRYTLIGDTVNTSSRMESNSSPGRILCSDKAANLLMKQCPRIPLTFRGEIEVKGKGKMGTFWVSTDIHRTETKAVAGTTNGSLSLASTKHGGVRFAGENSPLLG